MGGGKCPKDDGEERSEKVAMDHDLMLRNSCKDQ